MTPDYNQNEVQILVFSLERRLRRVVAARAFALDLGIAGSSGFQCVYPKRIASQRKWARMPYFRPLFTLVQESSAQDRKMRSLNML
jgi:hypothetical protein